MRLEDKHTSPLNMLEKCSLLDNMPLAFCVIELVFNEDGRGVDFIFSLLQCGNGESGGGFLWKKC